MNRATILLLVSISFSLRASAEDWNFKQQLLPALAEKIPAILKSQDPKTGRFGTGVFIVRDQEPIYALSAAWASGGDGNPYYHSDEVIRAIIAGGDALIAEQKPTGMWIFRKKDNSEWGDIYMPWTYSRWIRAYALTRDAMPPETREKWERALTLGFEGVLKTELVEPVQNIPAHDAMGLYLAGKTLNHPDWCAAAKEYMKKVVDAQYPDGYWTEHVGPVINYGFVYVEAVGLYYAMSRDPDVLPALKRAAEFHSRFVYPDGRPVETVDERNPYEASAVLPNLGFTFSTVGRSWAKTRMEQRLRDKSVGADMLASYILYGEEGAIEAIAGPAGRPFITQDGNAAIYRSMPWFACLTSYRADVKDSRWIQDRQNFFSLFHGSEESVRAGEHLIVGGGNTKLQPLWSTFTVGDTNLLKHKPGDENPAFLAPAGIIHVPTAAKLDPEQQQIELGYGDVKCRVAVNISDPSKAKITYALLTPTEQHVEAHVTLLPKMKALWRTASEKSGTLSAEPIQFAAGEAGVWFQLGGDFTGETGCHISVPQQATITWPVLPHNPYTKDGHAEPQEGRIVMTLPFSRDVMSYEISVACP